MNTTTLDANPPNDSSSLFDGPISLVPYHGRGELRPAAAARLASLERQAPQIVDRARSAGVEIKYLGTSALFDDIRYYPGANSDWVFGPAGQHERIVVPGPQRRTLRQLTSAGIDFPATFIAHEVPKERSAEIDATKAGVATTLDRLDAAMLVGDVPAPHDALALGENLGGHAQRILSGIGKAAPVVGGAIVGVGGAIVAVAAAPFVLAAGAVAALATLDPIVFGAIPVTSNEPGSPAVWFQLVAWEW